MRASLSILGLYNYDTTIFENFTVPTGVDAATALNTLIYDNAPFEILYPDPATMKFMIGLWCTKEMPIWERVYTAVQAQYNPIQNYNRTESWTDATGENATGSSSTTTEAYIDEEDKNSVVGYNETAFTNKDKTERDGHDTTFITGNSSGNRNETTTHTGNISGNIGVTTSQEMLEQELEVAPKLDIYKYISESFKQRFCLMVY